MQYTNIQSLIHLWNDQPGHRPNADGDMQNDMAEHNYQKKGIKH